MEYTDHSGHPHSLFKIFDWFLIGSQGSNASSGLKLRFWSDCVDAQTDLNLHRTQLDTGSFEFSYTFLSVCLYVPCGHLLGKGWHLGSRLWCLTVNLSLSHVVSWVRCGTWLYRFLIFATQILCISRMFHFTYFLNHMVGKWPQLSASIYIRLVYVKNAERVRHIKDRQLKWHMISI